MRPSGLCIRAFVLLIVATGAVGAQTIRTTPTNISLNHNPDARVSKNNSIVIQCSGYIGTFTVAFAVLSVNPTPEPDNLDYGLFFPTGGSGSRLSLTGNPTLVTEVLQDSFPAGSRSNTRKTIRFEMASLPGTLPTNGTYVINLQARLYQGGLPLSGSPVATANFTLTIVVAKRTALSIVPHGAAFNAASTSQNLSFDQLSPGKVRLVDAIVRSNTSYTLSIASANLGMLKHTDPKDDSLIPYQLTVGGENYGLSGGTATPPSTTTSTGFAGTPYELGFEILEYVGEEPSEGTYTDALTLTLTAP